MQVRKILKNLATDFSNANFFSALNLHIIQVGTIIRNFFRFLSLNIIIHLFCLIYSIYFSQVTILWTFTQCCQKMTLDTSAKWDSDLKVSINKLTRSSTQQLQRWLRSRGKLFPLKCPSKIISMFLATAAFIAGIGVTVRLFLPLQPVYTIVIF